MSSSIRALFETLQPLIFDDLENAIVGNNEVPFIKAFVPALSNTLKNTLSGHGLRVITREAIVHAKPKVDYVNSAGKKVNCELADILFVVKYLQADRSNESRSVFYQVKCAQRTTTTKCDIDQIQLELLRDWPEIEFGLVANGGPAKYSVSPTTDELGSYILMQRRPKDGGMLVPAGNSKCYGWAAPAAEIDRCGPLRVDCTAIPNYDCPDMTLFEQIALDYGEPNVDLKTQALIEAVYRHVGLAPDPPDEFEGYYEEDGAFAVLEMVAGVDEETQYREHLD